MNILIACEESQVVCKAFREKGHEAYSCDIIECSGGHTEWHIMQDVLPLLDGDCEFKTADGITHKIIGEWDMIIAFPPCTYLTVTGNRWYNREKYGARADLRLRERAKAVEFFLAIWSAKCKKVVIENPIGVMSTHFRKPDQIIHPYYFAEKEDDENCERKSTCLWIRNVSPLLYKIQFSPRIIKYKNGKGTDSPWHMETMKLPPIERAKARSKTFPGFAKALALQYGGVIDGKE